MSKGSERRRQLFLRSEVALLSEFVPPPLRAGLFEAHQGVP
jgi:hypothetical protein